jgi:hypothetical protein
LFHLESDGRIKAPSTVSYGFSKDRTLPCALKKALELRHQHPWVLKTDIIKFFDEIDRDRMKNLVCRTVRSKMAAHLICNAVDCELEHVTGRLAEIVNSSGIKRGVGLRQGMPLSPFLSNLLLRDFDHQLERWSKPAIRYADDIIVFGNTQQDCWHALELVTSELAKLGLHVPELDGNGKTAIYEPQKPVEFLGLEIKRSESAYKFSFPRYKMDRIEADMAATATISECKKAHRTIGQLVRCLDAFVAGHHNAMSMVPNHEVFLERMEAAKRKALVRLMTELIGREAIDRLSPTGRSILGLEQFGA